MQRIPTATFTELTEGKPVFPMSGRPAPDFAAAGYETSEWAVAGEAVSYSVEEEIPESGRITLAEADTAPFATRVLVHRPADPEAFSGVVLVEWLNVSGGQDAAPDLTYLAEEILRAGHVWIGLSAQYIAVEGGEAAVSMGGQAAGLRSQRRRRYGGLHHPGDAYAYDILTQVGRGARDPDAGGPLGDLRPATVIAVGESQSAFALTSYVNGVHPLAGVFDAFLLHSRGAGSLSFDDRGRAADIDDARTAPPVRLRDDLATPVLVVQAEGDLGAPLHAVRCRQPDTDHLVSWEIAGQAHADAFQLGGFVQFVDCGVPVNSGQQVFVLRAGLRHLVAWARGGPRPPSADPIEVDDEVVRGDLGNGRGGVRTPAVEAPAERLVGTPRPDAPPMCMLLGRTEEVPQEELRARWSGREEYVAAYREATDRLIAEGFLIADDREEILADARPGALSW